MNKKTDKTTKSPRKLKLGREVLRSLAAIEMAAIAGGATAPTIHSRCDGGSCTGC